MKNHKQNPHFILIGNQILKWYGQNARELPFRNTKNPYNIWICEIIFQQTRIAQGMQHYENFVARFPDVKTLANAHSDEVLLYWKGLGYYSRALNIHKASHQIMNDFGGVFPEKYEDILYLKGIGKYTAAAVSSICFGKQIPAIDGNFYRVLSRIYADDFDISSSQAYKYYENLALEMIPSNAAGDFNQAMMDLGSEVCKPRNPLCSECPVQENCIAFQTGKISEFPVKTKKVKVESLELQYYFVGFQEEFLIKQRGDDFIWKKLFEFPTDIPDDFREFSINEKIVKHKLTHKNLVININRVVLSSKSQLDKFAFDNGFSIINKDNSQQKSFPKPLENYIDGL
ncbi:A/G-specific adenine glycosylase [Frigoriflavimonas asaccharolytica]|uniref:A/G-specific adenine glycosylase n=1 Tax=Frigoriflavimonas asaccharolytica TaxID=2735899 RepID=A0A8J8G881_9FLAO|nr:A/G-specific adenine glycosylase [Frigoriflavimonas asaccharolytica]NRS91737.1 A/G-specific adenine glycosylase [Frigoriflavimonas asaccharolytica]